MLIRFTATWRHGADFFNAGDYRVPLDMTPAEAEAALAQGAAVRLDSEPKRKAAAPENKAARAAESK